MTEEEDPSARLADHLADNLRDQRQRRDLTQKQLAQLAGIPRSTVAQLEVGGNPTLSVLARLAAALHLSLEELLSAPRARCELFRRGSLPVSVRGRGMVTVHKLLPDPLPGMEIDRMELEPKARMVGIPHRPGTREYLACERGQIILWASGERFDLEIGDVAAFPGDQAHSYQNDGDVTAIGFSVVTLAPSR
jgi:XRE family transcriptional regulator, regulator of sulfur utilization